MYQFIDSYCAKISLALNGHTDMNSRSSSSAKLFVVILLLLINYFRQGGTPPDNLRHK